VLKAAKRPADGATCLHAACGGGGSAEVVRFLLSRMGPEDIAARLDSGATRLHAARGRSSSAAVLRLPLDRVDPATLEAQLSGDAAGVTRLHLACMNDRADLVALLCGRGGRGLLGAALDTGATALDLAARYEKPAIYEVLRSAGARHALLLPAQPGARRG
jgi:hypothetical protein